MRAEWQESFKKLTVSLEEMIKAYRVLLDMVRKEKEVLVASDLDQLNEINVMKEKLLIKIRGLEQVRMNYTKNFCKLIGLDSEAPRLLDMASSLGGDEGEKLRNIHNVLDLLLKRIKENGQMNEMLAENALKNLQGAMESIKDTLQGKKNIYGRTKEMSVRLPQAAFVSKDV